MKEVLTWKKFLDPALTPHDNRVTLQEIVDDLDVLFAGFNKRSAPSEFEGCSQLRYTQGRACGVTLYVSAPASEITVEARGIPEELAGAISEALIYAIPPWGNFEAGSQEYLL